MDMKSVVALFISVGRTPSYEKLSQQFCRKHIEYYTEVVYNEKTQNKVYYFRKK